MISMKSMQKTAKKLASSAISALKKKSPIILAACATVGVVGTVILSVRAGIKSEKLSKNEEGLTDKEIYKETIKAYAPVAIAGALTIFSIVSSQIISQKQQAALLAACMTLKEAYTDYRKTNIELYGEEADDKIMETIHIQQSKETPIRHDGLGGMLQDELPPTGTVLMWTEYTGYFNIDVAQVHLAELHLNRTLQLEGYCSFLRFLEFLGVQPSYDETQINTNWGELEILGWSYNTLVESWETAWFDVWHRKNTLEDGVECYTFDFACELEDISDQD